GDEHRLLRRRGRGGGRGRRDLGGPALGAGDPAAGAVVVDEEGGPAGGAAEAEAHGVLPGMAPPGLGRGGGPGCPAARQAGGRASRQAGTVSGSSVARAASSRARRSSTSACFARSNSDAKAGASGWRGSSRTRSWINCSARPHLPSRIALRTAAADRPGASP